MHLTPFISPLKETIHGRVIENVALVDLKSGKKGDNSCKKKILRKSSTNLPAKFPSQVEIMTHQIRHNKSHEDGDFKILTPSSN